MVSATFQEPQPTGRARHVVCVLFVGLGTLAAGMTPVVRVTSERLSVATSTCAGYEIACPGPNAPVGSCTARAYGVDPWGREIRIELIAPTVPGGLLPEPRLYSAGANGIDEHGRGDDIVPTETESTIGGLLYLSPALLGTLAIFLGWMLWGPFARGARGRLTTELGRAVVLASGPAALPFAAYAYLTGPSYLWHLLRYLVWSSPDVMQGGFVPFRLAFPVTWVLVFWSLALAWRLRRPADPAAEQQWPPELLATAHKHSFRNRAEITGSQACACFYCLAGYPASEVTEWTDENESGVGQTALCPRCSIDSVLGDASGVTLSLALLRAMRKHFFTAA